MGLIAAETQNTVCSLGVNRPLYRQGLGEVDNITGGKQILAFDFVDSFKASWHMKRHGFNDSFWYSDPQKKLWYK